MTLRYTTDAATRTAPPACTCKSGADAASRRKAAPQRKHAALTDAQRGQAMNQNQFGPDMQASYRPMTAARYAEMLQLRRAGR